MHIDFYDLDLLVAKVCLMKNIKQTGNWLPCSVSLSQKHDEMHAKNAAVQEVQLDHKDPPWELSSS